MNIACPDKINFCPCTDNPLANLTSEAPDRELFIQIHYNAVLGPAPVLLCEEADLVDLANCPQVCDPTIETCPCDISTDCCDSEACHDGCTNKCCSKPKPASCVPPVIFYNQESTCSKCDSTVTIPAGTVSSAISQADANAKAQAICEYRACFGPGKTESPCVGHPKPFIIGFTQPSPITASVGDDLTLTVLYTFSGSDPLTFTWYKDFTPFQVTPGPYLTLNNLATGDAGIYQLKITLPDCPGANSSLMQLIVNITDCTGIPVPSTFLEDDNTIFDTTGLGLVFKESLISTGKFRVKYFSGSYETCDHANADCSGALVQAFTTAPASVTGQQFVYSSSTWVGLFGPTIDYEAFAGVCPAAQEAAALALFHADSPDGWLVDGFPNPIEFVMDDLGAAAPQPKIRTRDGITTFACNGANRTVSGSVTCNIVRTGKFISEPYSVSIVNFASFMASCKPITADGPICGPVWNGTIDEDFHMGEHTLSILNITEKCFENLHIISVQIGVVLGVKWTISITGFWSEGGIDQPDEVLWQGEKTCGTTPQGIYNKTGSFVPGADDQLSLT